MSAYQSQFQLSQNSLKNTWNSAFFSASRSALLATQSQQFSYTLALTPHTRAHSRASSHTSGLLNSLLTTLSHSIAYGTNATRAPRTSARIVSSTARYGFATSATRARTAACACSTSLRAAIAFSAFSFAILSLFSSA